jgi:hypothetical protein
VLASVIGVCWFVTTDLSANEDSIGKYDGYYWAENEKVHIRGEWGQKRFEFGYRLGAYVKEENFIAVLGSDGSFAGSASSDGTISARKFLRFHRKFQQDKYTHYDGKIVGNEIHMRIRQALSDKMTALCDYGVLVLKKTAPPKEPTEEEKAQRWLLRFNEHFSNALWRYRVANDCMQRDRMDAESIIREMLIVYREEPRLFTGIRDRNFSSICRQSFSNCRCRSVHQMRRCRRRSVPDHQAPAPKHRYACLLGTSESGDGWFEKVWRVGGV